MCYIAFSALVTQDDMFQHVLHGLTVRDETLTIAQHISLLTLVGVQE